jgi:PAS domain-containing protein
MAANKPIQLILARQLASSVAMPILLMDADGTLVFYNEAAEAILNHRFDETGEIPGDELIKLIEIADEDHNPVPPEQRPMRVVRMERRPVSRTIWTRTPHTEWKHLQVTAVPLVGESGALLGVMLLFWEI